MRTPLELERVVPVILVVEGPRTVVLVCVGLDVFGVEVVPAVETL